MRLNQEIVALMRSLDAEHGTPALLTDAPKQMFEFNFVSRLGTGALQLTKTGTRALFQAECIEALEQTLAGAQPAMFSGVERWLTSSGFLSAADKSITARGKLWLASLTPDAPETGAPAPVQDNFAARRSAA